MDRVGVRPLSDMASGEHRTFRQENPRVFIVDDHPIVRLGLIRLINAQPELEFAGEAESGPEALEALDGANPGLIIVDLALKGMDGIELIKEIRKRYELLPVLVLSMLDETVYAERALRAGATGYVMKQAATETLLEAIRRVLRGEVYVSESMTSRILRQLATGRSESGSPVEDLSDRELQVFRMIGQGQSTREVAEELKLSIKTIETYRENIKKKLGLSSASELVHRAVEWIQREKAPG